MDTKDPELPELILDRICLQLGEKQVLNDLSLEIGRGALCCLLGPSGCGKTSLLNTIAGFYSPLPGKILLNGKEITRTPPRRRNIGMVFQNYALFPHLSVFQNVAYGLKQRRWPKDRMQSAVEKHLRLVHLDGLGHRRMHELPGGQQQRVALARVLVLEPAVLPLDEPLSILEAQLRVDTFPTIFETGDPLILEVDDYNPDVVYDIDSSVSFVFPKDKLIRVAQEDRLKNNNRSNASHDGIG